MHRADTHCHWCGEVKGGFTLPSVSTAALRRVAALAMVVTAAGGVWRFGPSVRAAIVAAAAEQAAATPVVEAPAARVAVNVVPLATAQPAADGPKAAEPDVRGDGESNQADAAYVTADDRTIRWVPAVARTWVNVRSDASRGGEVVGVIKPASRAMLGTDRAGWRQVRSPDVSGWVDPRLFEPDSLRPRGE